MENARKSTGGSLSCADVFTEFCPNITVLFDSEGKFASCTKTLLDAAGLEGESAVAGRSYREVFAEIMDAEACARLVGEIEKLGETKEPGTINGYADLGGRGPRYYNIELRAVTGAAEGTLAVFTDLTDIMAEKSLADVSNRAKTNFLAAATREIRETMDSIAEAADKLSRTRLTAKQKEYVNSLKESSNSLLPIIEDMEHFSKNAEGEFDITKNYYSIKGLFENLYAMFWPLFRTKNLEFYYSVSKEMPELTYGDEKRLKQVLVNILSNGLKYTPEGHVEFYAWMSEENVLHVGIHDTGTGIQEKDIEKLYLPFDQLDPDKKEEMEGAGFGLAVSRKLCEMMDGEFSIESTYGAGTTFSVHIPFGKEVES